MTTDAGKEVRLSSKTVVIGGGRGREGVRRKMSVWVWVQGAAGCWEEGRGTGEKVQKCRGGQGMV